MVRAMKILFTKHKIASYYGIIGFVTGSLISLYINGDMMAYLATGLIQHSRHGCLCGRK